LAYADVTNRRPVFCAALRDVACIGYLLATRHTPPQQFIALTYQACQCTAIQCQL